MVFNLTYSAQLEDLICSQRGWYHKCMNYLWKQTQALGLVWGPGGCVEHTCWGRHSSHWALWAVLWSVFGPGYRSSGHICPGSECTGSAAWSGKSKTTCKTAKKDKSKYLWVTIGGLWFVEIITALMSACKFTPSQCPKSLFAWSLEPVPTQCFFFFQCQHLFFNHSQWGESACGQHRFSELFHCFVRLLQTFRVQNLWILLKGIALVTVAPSASVYPKFYETITRKTEKSICVSRSVGYSMLWVSVLLSLYAV